MNVKSILKKENLMPVLVLVAICLVSAALMGCVNMLTAPIIADRNEGSVLQSLKEVMPDGEFNNEPDELPANAPETVKQIYTEKNGKGSVVILETKKGYTGNAIGITVAIDPDGRIIKMVITQNGESIVPDNMKPFGDYGDAFAGATESEVADIVTGATVAYTEAAIKNALKDAFFVVVGGGEEERLPKTDEEIVALAEELLDVSAGSLINVTPEGGSGTTKRVYRDKTGDNYAVYAVVVSSYYGTVETETLIHIDRNGVIKGIEKLTWSVSEAKPEWGYNPPTEEALDAFYAGLVGKDSESIGDVDLQTGATNTTTNLVISIAEGIELVKALSLNNQ